jgi:hypothetical protein
MEKIAKFRKDFMKNYNDFELKEPMDPMLLLVNLLGIDKIDTEL